MNLVVVQIRSGPRPLSSNKVTREDGVKVQQYVILRFCFRTNSLDEHPESARFKNRCPTF